MYPGGGEARNLAEKTMPLTPKEIGDAIQAIQSSIMRSADEMDKQN